MRRFRRLRRRKAALALVPVTAALSMMMIAPGAASGAEADSASFDARGSKVKVGAKVKVRGKFPPRARTQSDGQAKPSRRVWIEFRPAGNDSWRRAKTTVSTKDGRYKDRVKVKRSGHLRAVHADGRTTRPDRVRVKARVKAKLKTKHARLGEKIKVKGRVRPGTRRKVVVRIGGDKLKAKSNRKGRFKVRWKADKVGSFRAVVKAKGDKVAAGDSDKAGRATVYRPAQASWYGPGFYGNRTACGQTLTTSTVGVAHKTMPCGTRLRLHYKGRTVKVKVIDRGPYHGNREFDLTGAAKQKLGFGSTGTVWASK
jgi:rare lipoprotein A